MHGTFINIQILITAAILSLAASSCIYDDEPAEAVERPQDNPTLVLNMQLPSMRSGTADNGAYEPGTGYENYIDLTDDGFRIYLFDNNNKFLLRFIPMLLSPSENGASDTYTAVGEVPAALESINGFKVVVLANWPSYSDSGLIPGVSTVDDLCGAEWAQFNRLKEYELNPDKGLTIPFYGIHDYTGVTFAKGNLTTLGEPVTLLRAMAKVEVILDNSAISLSDVTIHGFNAKGYCAPAGVYSQTDYDHNGNWSEDYVKTLHLPGNANDAVQENNVSHLYCKNRSDGSQKETWICYVPEYKNTDNADGTVNYKSHIELKLDIQEPGDAPFEVFFADYDENGKLIPGSDFDILRNNCYRFIVNLSHGALIIKVQKWENAYDNDFQFQ